MDGKYVLFENSGFMLGTIKGNERGFAFFIPQDKTMDDFFLPPKSLLDAMHGDTVYARKVYGKSGSSDEAEVVKVVKRGITSLVGTYYAERNFGFVRPDEKSYYSDIFIPSKSSLNASSGDKVLIEITSFPLGKNPEGKVKEVLGRQFDLKSEELSIIKNFGFPDDFEGYVYSEVEKIPDVVLEEEIVGRMDLRDKLTITIDGDDSRDFDDAITLEKTSNGNYLLGVHIADVSHYVKEGSKIDEEAFNRANSVYFPDMVIPMLPKALSNGICSLNEGVDRLTVSCIMEIDSTGSVVDKIIDRSVINSNHRMTYKKVQAIMDGDKDIREQYSDIVDLIEESYKLREILSLKRKERGSVNLEVKEAHVTITPDGEIDVEPSKNLLSYNLIEEFMLVANETIAEYLYYMSVPCVYRVHEKPSEEKAQSFIEFLKLLGINVRWKAENCHPKDFQTLLSKIKDQPYYGVVNKVMLRSMQKAVYSPENSGHFGLSAKNYCHFTSPIRRYPDLCVHRALKTVLDGTVCGEYEQAEIKVQEVSLQASESEKRSDEAERQVDDLYKAYYMMQFKGYEADGVISGVTNFGVFVELENTVEGIIKLEDLPKGKYVFDQKTFTLSSSRHTLKLGESVKILVAGVDLRARRVEFIFIKKLNALQKQ